MRRIKDVFRPEYFISDKKLKSWLEDGLKKGYKFSSLRRMLLRYGLKDEASKLILLHKPLSVNKDKTGLILLFLCAFFFGLFLTSSFILNAGSLNGKLTWRGYIISMDKNPGAIVNVNFDDEVGKVREDFYGTNIQSNG